MVKNVCIYCAASPGIEEIYFRDAETLTAELVKNGIAINYGAGAIGLMGAVANTALKMGGKITGFIPRFMLDEKCAHTGLENLVTVESMHDRKREMIRNVDAIIALPGGVGTLEELMEAIALKQLGRITIPIVLLNTNGFFNELLVFFKTMILQKFLQPVHRELWLVTETPAQVIRSIMSRSGSVQSMDRLS